MCLAVPGKILEITGDDPMLRMARVSFSGVVRQVSLACLPEAKLGDWVLVHVGLAIAALDEAEAEQQLADLRRILELAPEPEPEPGP
ncbi:MAG: HypC/HybG/HupF family hydrogenase formation chaperone [Myxococcales bacterium]|nr:HypC/HybG/HupF family hydrogenase formation chaperone [Myxococcales bacterium]